MRKRRHLRKIGMRHTAEPARDSLKRFMLVGRSHGKRTYLAPGGRVRSQRERRLNCTADPRQAARYATESLARVSLRERLKRWQDLKERDFKPVKIHDLTTWAYRLELFRKPYGVRRKRVFKDCVNPKGRSWNIYRRYHKTDIAALDALKERLKDLRDNVKDQMKYYVKEVDNLKRQERDLRNVARRYKIKW